MRVLVFAAALYLLTPGHPDILLSGVPIGQTGAFLLIALLVCGIWTRDVEVAVPATLIRALGVAIAVKLAIALLVPQSGWLAAYYANDQLTPPARKSTEFFLPGATRIDRQLAFVDTEFPVHFFNDNDEDFNVGVRREAVQPFSVLWRGHVDGDEPIRVAYEARGEIELAVDGVTVNSQPATVEAGKHVIDVRYRKAPEIEGAVHVQPLDGRGRPRSWASGEVTQIEVPRSQRAIARLLVPVAWVVHAIALLIFARGAWPVVRAELRRVRALPLMEMAHACVMPVVIFGLSLQGLWKARHLVGQVWTLTGGDDWLAFEAEARDALLNGWMILEGQPIGRGFPFIVYPGYSYFVAFMHRLTGESLAGIIFANFVVLAIASVLVYAVALRFTTRAGALIALLWLLALEQVDFVRYYTVTLLSENLFFMLLAATVYALVRFCRGGPIAWLVLGGIAGGLGAITRPTLMVFLPVAVILTALARSAERRRSHAFAAPLVLVVCWMGAIAPITYRNFVVSGTPVLITAGQAKTFINYNLPNDDAANAKYKKEFRGSMASAVRVLLWILWEHPAETLRNWGIKASFTLGMVHWMGSGTPHPELLLTSLLYLTALFLVRTARTLPAFLIHGFVFTHLATMLLSMPSNYGYRMILPMYLMMVVFVGALGARFVERWSARQVRVAPAG